MAAGRSRGEAGEEAMAEAAPRPVGSLFRLLVYGLVLASSSAQFAIVPIMPTYAHRFGLSGFQQGMVLGATGIATLAVSVPAGALSDRFGARRLTLWAGLLMAIAALAQSLAGAFPALVASRLVFGIGYGVVWTAASDRSTICAAAAIVTTGVTTGVSALLVPAQLRAAGASPGRIGLDFSIAGM